MHASKRACEHVFVRAVVSTDTGVYADDIRTCVNMCMRMCERAHVPCVSVLTRVYVCAYVCEYVCAYVRMCVCAYVRMCERTCVRCVHVCLCA
jgi:hypothetical protein